MPFAPAAAAIDNGTALVAFTLLVTVIAAVVFARSGPAWSSIGRGPLAIHEDPDASGRSDASASPVDPAIQAAEVRQMLAAKAERQRRRGEAPVDVENEATRLLAASEAPGSREAMAAELRDEVRQLVLARNERRLRQGLEPLDVEAETERQLADLIGSP